jgi:hypothetical protein
MHAVNAAVPNLAEEHIVPLVWWNTIQQICYENL